MKVEMAVIQDETMEGLIGDPMRTSGLNYIDFEIRVDGVVVFRIERGREATITMSGKQKLDDLMAAIEKQGEVARHLHVYGTALVVRQNDGSLAVIDPSTYTIRKKD